MTKCDCFSHDGFLTAKGLEEAAQRIACLDEGLAVELPLQYLDKVGSVSAMVEVEEFHVFDDQLLDQQYRRFLSG